MQIGKLIGKMFATSALLVLLLFCPHVDKQKKKDLTIKSFNFLKNMVKHEFEMRDFLFRGPLFVFGDFQLYFMVFVWNTGALEFVRVFKTVLTDLTS